MGPEHVWWSGWWVLPILMPILMLICAFVMMRMMSMCGRGGFRMPMCGHFGGHATSGEEAGPALEILRARYAKGEISKDEFDRMRADLS